MVNFKCLSACLLAVSLLAGCSSSPEVRERKYLQRGKAHLAKKDFNRAVLEFRNATKAMPRDAEAYYQLGLAYLGSAGPASAVGAFRKALELNPRHAGARLKLAEFMAASRNGDLIKQAVELIHSVLASSPDNTEAIDAMAIAEWRLGKREDAEARLNEVLRKFPADLQSAVTLARFKLSRGDLAGATEPLLRAARSAPQSAPAAMALAQLYVMSKQPEQAEREAERALRLDPNYAAALLLVASIQMGAKRYHEADQTFRRIAALPGKRYRSAHAMFLYATGKRDAAIAELEKLVKEDSGDRATRSRLVRAYFDNGQLQRADQILVAALKKNPRDAEALFQRSELNLKSGKVALAAEDMKEVIRLTPDSAQAHSVLAAVYQAQHLPHSEQQELNEALRLDPGLLPVRLRLARSFLQQNAGQSALHALDRAPPAQKSAVAWFEERGWALLMLRNTDELRRGLDRVLRVNRSPELLLQDAILRMQEHDYARARADCDEVLAQTPDEIRAARILVESYVAQKQPEKAGEKLVALASAHGQSAPLQEVLGEWYVKTGKLPEARKAFESAKRADFKFVPADLSLADLDRRENHIDAARQRLKMIIAADSQNVSALRLLGDLEYGAGNLETSVAQYRAVLAVDSSNMMALNNLAYALAAEHPDEALRFAQEAAQIAPESAAVADTLGWVYYRKGAYNTAVDYLKEAVSKEPTPRREFHLAMCYIKNGEQARGGNLLQTALQADPALPKTEQGW